MFVTELRFAHDSYYNNIFQLVYAEKSKNTSIFINSKHLLFPIFHDLIFFKKHLTCFDAFWNDASLTVREKYLVLILARELKYSPQRKKEKEKFRAILTTCRLIGVE